MDSFKSFTNKVFYIFWSLNININSTKNLSIKITKWPIPLELTHDIKKLKEVLQKAWLGSLMTNNPSSQPFKDTSTLNWKTMKSESKFPISLLAKKISNSWNRKISMSWFLDTKLLESLKRLVKRSVWEKLVRSLVLDSSKIVARIANFVGVERRNYVKTPEIHWLFFLTSGALELTFKFLQIGPSPFPKIFLYLKPHHCFSQASHLIALLKANSKD